MNRRELETFCNDMADSIFRNMEHVVVGNTPIDERSLSMAAASVMEIDEKRKVIRLMFSSARPGDALLSYPELALVVADSPEAKYDYTVVAYLDGNTDTVYNISPSKTASTALEFRNIAEYPVSQKENITFLVGHILTGLIFVFAGIFMNYIGTLIAPDHDPVRFVRIFSPVETCIGTLAVLIVFCVAISFINRLIDPDAYMERKIANRQGAYGSIMQVPAGLAAICFAITGISEEMLFRFGSFSLVSGGALALGAEPSVALIIAVVVSTVFFAVAHAGTYDDFSSIVSVFLLGLALGVAYAVSGSLIALMVAHAVYDFIVYCFQCRTRIKDPLAYFGGKRPVAHMSGKTEEEKFWRY